MKRKRTTRAAGTRRESAGPADPEPVTSVEVTPPAATEAEGPEVGRLLDTWVNLEKEFAALRADRDRLIEEADARQRDLAEQQRLAAGHQSQVETLKEELAAARRRIEERTALEGRSGRGTADQRLADYRDALLGMEQALAERDRSMLRHATEKAELAARIAELERQVAEITGRWREADAAGTRLQAMLTEAARQGERLEGDLRRVRDEAVRLARELGEKSKLVNDLRATGAQGASAQEGAENRLRELGAALQAERERAGDLADQLRERDRRVTALEAALDREKTEGGKSRIEALEARLAELQREVEATDNAAGLAVAARDRVAGELNEKQALIAGLEQRVAELAGEIERDHESRAQLEAEVRRQQNTISVLEREVERLEAAEGSARKRDSLAARHAAVTDTDRRRKARLVVSLEGDQNIKYPLYKSAMVIGRASDADIHVVGRFTSRRHARILILEDDTAVIEDLGSLNGIRVNDLPVHRQVLHDGDMLDVGGARLQFIDLAERDTARSSAG